MKIYTKTGTGAETGLYGGQRVPKDHGRMHAYGTLDELNAWLGLALAERGEKGAEPFLRKCLKRTQGELFNWERSWLPREGSRR